MGLGELDLCGVSSGLFFARSKHQKIESIFLILFMPFQFKLVKYTIHLSLLNFSKKVVDLNDECKSSKREMKEATSKQSRESKTQKNTSRSISTAIQP